MLANLDVLDDHVALRATRLLAEVYLRQGDRSATSGDGSRCADDAVADPLRLRCCRDLLHKQFIGGS